MANKNLPVGVDSYRDWWEEHPDPTLCDLLDRYKTVDQAVVRYREAKATVPTVWLAELGVTALDLRAYQNIYLPSMEI